ncbi:MAG: hypothetical protein SVU88_01325, partial [Candidatus Nanohaloarchaea archaeon]|nr:hypothetical protein [Candidatus Nanohaloarchaea archaeon]
LEELAEQAVEAGSVSERFAESHVRRYYDAHIEAHEDFEFADALKEAHPDLVEPEPQYLRAVTAEDPLEVDYQGVPFEIDMAVQPQSLPAFRYPIEHYFTRRSVPWSDRGVENNPRVTEEHLAEREPDQYRLDDFGVDVPPPERQHVSDYVQTFHDVVRTLKEHDATFFITGSLARETDEPPSDIDIAVQHLYSSEAGDDLAYDRGDLEEAIDDLVSVDMEETRTRVPGGIGAPERALTDGYGGMLLYSFDVNGVSVDIGYDKHPLTSKYNGDVPEDFHGEVQESPGTAGMGTRVKLIAPYTRF